MELVNKREFVEAGIDKNGNIFVVHVAVLEALELVMSIQPLETPLLAILQ